MMDLSRRGFLGGAALVGLAAPAIITTPGLLMRVKSFFMPSTSLTIATQAHVDFQFVSEELPLENLLLTPSIIARQTLAILSNNLIAAGKVNRLFDRQFDKIGRKLSVRVDQDFAPLPIGGLIR